MEAILIFMLDLWHKLIKIACKKEKHYSENLVAKNILM